jgi:hypothetical protein
VVLRLVERQEPDDLERRVGIAEPDDSRHEPVRGRADEHHRHAELARSADRLAFEQRDVLVDQLGADAGGESNRRLVERAAQNDKEGTRAHVGPQRRRPPGTLGHLSCKPVVSGGAAVGARMVIMDPGSWA